VSRYLLGKYLSMQESGLQTLDQKVAHEKATNTNIK